MSLNDKRTHVINCSSNRIPRNVGILLLPTENLIVQCIFVFIRYKVIPKFISQI